MRTLRPTLWQSIAPLLALAASAAAAEPVEFNRDVRPLLSGKCFQCHGPGEQAGGLRLDLDTAATRQLESGATAVLPGDPAASALLRRVTSEDPDLRMPAEGEPLRRAEIDMLRRWIAEGAQWQKHWAYVPPQRAALPAVEQHGWCRSPIDRFVLARLETAGLEPSPEADRARLLRRLSLDVIGLPPTVEEVEAFEADRRPGAYERQVERLLASQRFGERWARPWLDAARYGDSNGYQRDNRREVWAYRDWVVAALNADMPFDRFTIEQIAGDLLPNATLGQQIATGFHRGTLVNIEAGTDPAEERTLAIIDRVNTTATVWLGTTLECCQCHSHKYDPFTQKEYYQLYAFFNSTAEEIKPVGSRRDFVGPKVALPLSPDKSRQREELTAELARLQRAVDEQVATARQGFPAWEQQVASRLEEPTWHVLEPLEYSAEGSMLVKQADGSLLATGANPARTMYRVSAETALEGITAVRLEVLTDDSLPQRGPGRGDRPNFILSEFGVEAAGRAAVAEGRAEYREVPLAAASADFSQKGWPVAQAIDGDRKTGWAINPQFSKDHRAVFAAREKFGEAGGTRLHITLDQQYGAQRTIGRFRLSVTTDQPNRAAVPEAVRKILALPAAKRSARQSQQVLDYYVTTVPAVKQARDRLAAARKRLAAVAADTSLVMRELDAPRKTMVFTRGDFLKPGEEVQPATPEALHPLTPPADGRRPDRLALARWLVDERNPLVARVTVNRFWSEIFGQGLVTTPEDFGTQGRRPTHPELLDWLAVEFMKRGWSMKSLVRQLVTSATYRQSSLVTAERLARDPRNLLYSRGPRFRMPAEMIRDNALAIAGLLSERMGGPPVFPFQPPGVWNHIGVTSNTWKQSRGDDQYRRGLYVYWRRTVPYPSFVAFDAPSREMCTVQRSRSNTPLQALTLMNDPVYVEAAAALAARVAGDPRRTTPAARVDYAFRRALARRPADEERDVLLGCYREERARYASDAAAARRLAARWLNEEAKKGGLDDAEFAAWLHVAMVLLNLDEAITKG